MESFWTFLTNPTPNATIILIVALILIVPNIDKIAVYIPFLKRQKKISDVQDEKYPELIKMLRVVKSGQERIEKFESNHRLHEIPEMVKTLGSMNSKLDSVMEKQSEHGERISRIEGKLEK